MRTSGSQAWGGTGCPSVLARLLIVLIEAAAKSWLPCPTRLFILTIVLPAMQSISTCVNKAHAEVPYYFAVPGSSQIFCAVWRLIMFADGMAEYK